MSLKQTQVDTNKFGNVLKRTPHLKNYVETLEVKGIPRPDYYEVLSQDHKSIIAPNLIYPTSELSFVHVNGHAVSETGYIEYNIIEPDEPEKQIMDAADKMFATDSKDLVPPKEITEKFNMIEEYISKKFHPSKIPINYSKLNPFETNKLLVKKEDYEGLKYYFLRKRAGLGLLDPLLADSNLEDISIVGTGNLYVVHKIFGSLKCSVFLSADEIDEMMVNLSEQFGKTISHSKPIVDATLPEGSRINIVYGKDISRKGTNATIRRFSSIPFSITQLLASNTWSYEQAAYIWMILNEGMSIFINGETASGKTTSLMALTPFIPSNWKVVTIEDTPEMTMPHANWLNETTRDTGNANTSVTLFDLLKAALRQRPNYIIVGEIRGAEGATAFQAMQTGHPVISTFHAHNMTSLVQRLTNDPINIPKTHMENLNVALFQGAVLGPDGKRIRRVLSINEVLGYNTDKNSIMYIPVFEWDPVLDSVRFKGRGSSSIFTEKLLILRGMNRKDEKLLYEELAFRAKILKKMVDKKIFNFYEVFESISHCREVGLQEFYKELDYR